MAVSRDEANQEALRRLDDSEIELVGVARAGDIVPGFRSNLILTSGPPAPWATFSGMQREAIIGAALYEGLADDPEGAVSALDGGSIEVGACHDYGCVGSVAGVYSASMPVFVVRNATYGNYGFCNLYEGDSPRRLNYGCYEPEVLSHLREANDTIGSVLAAVLEESGPIAITPLMGRALRMGDELHSRNQAAGLLFAHAVAPALVRLARSSKDLDAIERCIDAMGTNYFFLRVSMAAAKAIADAAHGIASSSIVTALAFSCRGFAVRVSGCADRWFEGPHASFVGKLFDGYTENDIIWAGGESPITETVGLGGFAQAAALPLQRYQGGSAQVMLERNQAMAQITAGRSSRFLIPALDFQGSPLGIDVSLVVRAGIAPVMDVGICGRDGGQIGAGVITAPIECFRAAQGALETVVVAI